MSDQHLTPVQYICLYVGRIASLVIGVNLVADADTSVPAQYLGGGLLGLFVWLMEYGHDR